MKRFASTCRLLLAFAVAAAAGVAVCGGCRGGEATISGCPTGDDATTPVDPALMAFLSAARALHHEADIDESRGDVPAAVAALERLVGMQAPRAAEVDEVVADARARLAELRLRSGDVEGADRDVHAGLERAREATYFRGHLLEVAGIVEEARASSLSDAGRAGEAARAKARAIELLEEAVRVQGQVIDKALGDAGGP
jgi:hypothetical protein